MTSSLMAIVIIMVGSIFVGVSGYNHITEIQPTLPNISNVINGNFNIIPTSGIVLSSNYYYQLGCCQVFNSSSLITDKLCIKGNNGLLSSIYSNEKCDETPFGSLVSNLSEVSIVYYINHNLQYQLNFTCSQEVYSFDIPSGFGVVLLNSSGVLNVLDLDNTGLLLDLNTFPSSFYFSYFDRVVQNPTISFLNNPVVTTITKPPVQRILDVIINNGGNSINLQKTLTTSSSAVYQSSMSTQSTNTISFTNTVVNSLTNSITNTISSQSSDSGTQAQSISNVLSLDAIFVSDSLTVGGTVSNTQASSSTNSASSGDSNMQSQTNTNTQLNSFVNTSSFSTTNTFSSSNAEMYTYSILPGKILTVIESSTIIYETLDFSQNPFNVTACFPLENSCVEFQIFCPFVMQSSQTIKKLIFQSN